MIAPGFYGKLPSTGDFVTRRLPLEFVQPFDRWLAQHLAPLIGSDGWDAQIALRFLSGQEALGPAAGVIVSSADRAGRRFPLSIIARPTQVDDALVRSGWFRAAENLALAAQAGRLTADELDAALGEAVFPVADDVGGEIIDAMVVWTDQSELYDIDPEQPEPVLRQLLAVCVETG